MMCEWRHSPISVVKEISCKVTPGFKIVLIFFFHLRFLLWDNRWGIWISSHDARGVLLCNVKSSEEVILFPLILNPFIGFFSIR